MISLTPAAKEERVALENLMQLYSYDWSELGPFDVGDQGRFADYPLDAYWQEDWRHPFLLRVETKLAGFAMILERSRLTGTAGVFDMAEFFVMRRYRRKGVGAAAAAAAFDRFKGPWEIRQRRENVAATAFWRRVIGRYTGGKFDEVDWENATWMVRHRHPGHRLVVADGIVTGIDVETPDGPGRRTAGTAQSNRVLRLRSHDGQEQAPPCRPDAGCCRVGAHARCPCGRHRRRPAPTGAHVDGWNALLRSGAARDPLHGRVVLPADRRGIVDGPFWASPMLIGVNFPAGGFRTTDTMAVVDVFGAVVPGLYAAGDTAGGVNPCLGLGGIQISSAFTRSLPATPQLRATWGPSRRSLP